MNTAQVKKSLEAGELCIIKKCGKSSIWNTFGIVAEKAGAESSASKQLPMVACRQCLKCFKYISHTTGTTHLARHVEQGCSNESCKQLKLSVAN
uniref:ZF(BED)-1 zinc finger protein n=1 Tax=Phallusia mammillata TaxID=59560 RepID=A0A6F9DYR9_9ASCI|nr:ZF(BED)-1 zinc finger protein [Phallusia mammillata]